MTNYYKYSTDNSAFYHSKKWKSLRKLALKRDCFLCQECLKRGQITPASTVHHIRPLRVDRKQALKLENLETVCTACHNVLHPERSKRLALKKSAIRARRDPQTIVFKNNSELW